MLFDCLKCGGCCCGPAFDIPTVILTKSESEHILNKEYEPEEGFWYICNKQGVADAHGECSMRLPDKKCQIYENRPFCCVLYPLSLVGNNLVIQSECPQSKKFEKRFKAGDKEAVAFVKKCAKTLNEMTEDYREALRYDSGRTDNLFVYARIKGPECH
jgi:Fe-S-cluster containining protein